MSFSSGAVGVLVVLLLLVCVSVEAQVDASLTSSRVERIEYTHSRLNIGHDRGYIPFTVIEDDTLTNEVTLTFRGESDELIAELNYTHSVTGNVLSLMLVDYDLPEVARVGHDVVAQSSSASVSFRSPSFMFVLISIPLAFIVAVARGGDSRVSSMLLVLLVSVLLSHSFSAPVDILVEIRVPVGTSLVYDQCLSGCGTGRCGPDGFCICPSDRVASDCSVNIIDHGSCKYPSCNGHGTCSIDTEYLCECESGWGGDGCGISLKPSSCPSPNNSDPVAEPEFLKNLIGQTSWHASPIIYDLDGDGNNELISAYYNVYVFSHELLELDRATEVNGRVYAGHVVADLDGDGRTEIVVANSDEIIAWTWDNNTNTMVEKFRTATTGKELRGLAAADLNGDGSIEIVATSTDSDIQVFVVDHTGATFQPSKGHSPAWPRYNDLSGDGNDADRNVLGHVGFGCYGMNVGIGNLDDDSTDLEVVVTYDNHALQVFKFDGVAIDLAPYFTDRSTDNRLTYGKPIRWTDPWVDEDHHHRHSGTWPHPSWTEWLQFTQSPINVVDIDGDGINEIVVSPNIEMHEPYETQAYGLFVVEGDMDKSRSGMRKDAWERIPRGDFPEGITGIPGVTSVDILGDSSLELIVPMNDGYIYCWSHDAQLLWRHDYMHTKQDLGATEVIVADLNQDGQPELIYTTWGPATQPDSGFLVILNNLGEVLHDITLPNQGTNGNGVGSPAAVTVGDLTGDGQLEIVVQTFDHATDVFTVAGSGTNCLLWETARGGPLRQGRKL